MMNSLQAVLTALTDEQLRKGVTELHTLDRTGVLPAGVVRETARRIADSAGICAHDALSIAQTHFIRAAAFTWAGLPVFDQATLGAGHPGAVTQGMPVTPNRPRSHD